MKIFILFFTIIMSSIASANRPIEIKYMKNVFDQVLKTMQTVPRDEILLVFDIDNTLLTANQELGSHRWGQWQKKLIKKKDHSAVVSTLNELYKLETILGSLSGLHSTEESLPSIITHFGSLGISSIALTSRSHQMRSITERELKKNQYGFTSFSSGFPGKYIPKTQKPRFVSFQEGIYMTAGQNKGLMLQDLLRKTKKSFSTVIFVDDTHKHTIDMIETFKNSSTKVFSYRYSLMDNISKEFQLSDKVQVTKEWNNLKHTLNSIFK